MVTREGIGVIWSICIVSDIALCSDPPQWVRVVVKGELAEQALNTISRGDHVHVAGALQYRVWKDSRGKGRSETVLHATHVEIHSAAAHGRS